MKKELLVLLSATFAISSPIVFAYTSVEQLQQQLNQLKNDYEQRIKALEEGLRLAQNTAKKTQQNLEEVKQQAEDSELASDNTESISPNAFNPQISLILDGRYADYQQNPDDYKISGFSLGNEGGLSAKGFNIGESELVLSANVDQLFYGKLTLAFADENGSTEVGIEEAFAQTSGLFDGLTIKMGRFFSDIGYLNNQHAHAWDFADAPLIYRALFGDQYGGDGIQFSYTAPTELFLQVGGEIFNGSAFPASGSHNGIGSWTSFVKLGGDVGTSHSWQAGLSHWQANDINNRESTGLNDSITLYSGKSKINALDLIYKWAPNGNVTQNNFKLQFEYFDRDENGNIALNDFSSTDISTYKGDQKGWYTQGIYQFNSQWRTGLRYDRLSSHARGSNALVLNDAGLESDGYHPQRYSTMIEWLPSEFSRIRLQYNKDQSSKETDNQIFLQYTYSLGTHGAHSY